MFKGNKWEWSEVYALLRILADEKIYATDSETKEYTAREMISIYINGEKVGGFKVRIFCRKYAELRR